jgi:hypothetical protein
MFLRYFINGLDLGGETGIPMFFYRVFRPKGCHSGAYQGPSPLQSLHPVGVGFGLFGHRQVAPTLGMNPSRREGWFVFKDTISVDLPILQIQMMQSIAIFSILFEQSRTGFNRLERRSARH